MLWLATDTCAVNREVFPSVLRAARVGADWAWAVLHEELGTPLLAYARARGAADPDDVVGEVFLELARRCATFEGSWDAFRGWAFLLASRRVIDEHRRRRRRPEHLMESVPDAAGPDVTAETVDRGLDAVEARRLLDRVSPAQREVLVLRIYADLPLEQVAMVTGRSVHAVKALQRRGLAALRRELSRQAVST